MTSKEKCYTNNLKNEIYKMKIQKLQILGKSNLKKCYAAVNSVNSAI